MTRASLTIERQAEARLRIIRQRIATLQAEKEMIERMLAENERRVTKRPIALRKNGLSKMAAESRILRHLRMSGAPAKAHDIYNALRVADAAGLKPATFRSHLKRLTDQGLIKRQGPRGYYQYVRNVIDEPEQKEPRRPAGRIRIPPNYG